MLLVLIGYRGTGKTTVAELIAERLGAESWDADLEIERRAGCSIKQIFADCGESGFRDLEEQVIADLSAHPEGVLAVGGGAVLRAANRLAMARGTVFWLTADAQTIFARVNADPTTSERRPNLTTASGLEEIETLLAAREPLYRECADYSLSTESQTPDAIAAEIIGLVENPPAAS